MLDEFRKDRGERRKWEKFLEGRFPSADTIGYSLKRFNHTELRKFIHSIYTRLQRNHVVKKWRIGGYLLLSLDGHELFSSRRRHCSQCSSRVINTRQGKVKEYYHRVVVAQLVGGYICPVLDVELILPGEDEVTTAMRLFRRVVRRYPKAFDIITVDGLYLQARFVKQVLKHKKEIVCVIKDERRELFQDALGLFNLQSPKCFEEGKNYYEWWDEEGFRSWSSVDIPLRVVRSKEKVWRKGKLQSSEWLWATTLSKSVVLTRTIWKIGHHRWDIENQGFREAVTFYFLDHCFIHHPEAITAIILIFAIVYFLHKAFYQLNIKPSLRLKLSLQHFIILFLTEIYTAFSCSRSPP
jgi:hypothetical protein